MKCKWMDFHWDLNHISAWEQSQETQHPLFKESET